MQCKQEGRSPPSVCNTTANMPAGRGDLPFITLLPRYGSHTTVRRNFTHNWAKDRHSMDDSFTVARQRRGNLLPPSLQLWVQQCGISSQPHVEHIASPVKQPDNNEIITCSPLCVFMYPWLYIFPMQKAPFTARRKHLETQINKHGNQNQECIDLHFNPPCNFLCNKNLSVTYRAERASPSISFFQM